MLNALRRWARPPAVSASAGELTPDQRFQARIAEYNTVRAEWMSSRDAQQATLQWTFAALAILFAGILNSQVSAKHPTLFIGLSALAAFAATCSQAVWFGEVVRMERAAHYLRGVEAGLKGGTMMWERWRAYPVPERSITKPFRFPKAAFSVLGGVSLYGLLSLGGIGLLGYATQQPYSGANDTFAWAAATATTAFYLGVTGVIASLMYRISSLSKNPAPLEAFPAEARKHEKGDR